MVIIIWYGEIGKSIWKVVWEHDYIDIGNVKLDSLKHDVMHVCIPYSEDFVETVLWYLKYWTNKVYIHSTVRPWTCKKIQKKTDLEIYHCPIRWVHPNLEEGIRTFEMFISWPDVEWCNYFEDLWISTYYTDKYENTEYMKILSTAYYWWCILFCKIISMVAEKNKLDFDYIYTESNKTYNKGYKELWKDNVVRPVLTPPEGKIWGHCVSQNFELLNDEGIEGIFKSILIAINKW